MSASPQEYNVTGIDYRRREHLFYDGPIVDIHTHVTITRPDDPPNAPPKGSGPGASIAQAEAMLDVARSFGIERTVSMCPPDDIPVLRERFGNALLFNGTISKKTADESDDVAYRTLDRYLELGVKLIKYWAAPRGRERGLFVDAPWRIEAARRAQAAGIRLMMVHVADPDAWFRTVYADSTKFGTKPDQYVGLERMLSLFPELNWIGAHLGGDSEHPDHLEALLEEHPNLYFDTSATKWVVREVSQRRDAFRSLMTRYPDRFLFGSDLVTRHTLERDHYVSRYWCQRTLWESGWEGSSPIADPDYQPAAGQAPTPLLRGLALPKHLLSCIYDGNARRLLGIG
jgi:hypothetical protein